MRISDLLLRLKALIARRRVESELEEELKFHLEMEAGKRQRSGESAEAARLAARREFGGVEQVRERCRDARGVSMIENLGRDLRYGFRALIKAPGFSAIAVLSLAVGIGANTWVFSVIDRVLLRSLPVRNPEELVLIRWGGDGNPAMLVAGGAFYGREHDFDTNVFSWDTYRAMRAHGGAVKDLFGFAMFNSLVNVAGNGNAQVSGGMLVSGNFFASLGISTAIGRPILADDDAVDGVPAAVIGYRYWQTAFAGSRDVLGKRIYLNRQQHVIVGVAQRDFPSLAGDEPSDRRAYVILPLRARSYLDKEHVGSSSGPEWSATDRLWIQVMGRLNGSAQAQARGELNSILATTLPGSVNKLNPHVILEPGASGPSHTALMRQIREPLAMVAVATAIMLLIACANLAGLLLARGTRRRREICLRMSLGASRWRIVRQLLCESAAVSAAGAVGGILLARWGLSVLLPVLAAARRSLPGLDDRMDWRILAFTGLVFAVVTPLFGLLPALSATRVDLAEGMKEDAGTNRGSGRSRGVTLLVAAQAAAALLLVTGASLMTRTLFNLRGLPLGFDPDNVVIFGVSPQASGYSEARGMEFYERLTAQLRRTAGVTGVSLARNAPASGWTWNGGIQISTVAGHPKASTNFNFVGDGYFEVMRIRLVAGRAIDSRDLVSSRRIAVVNEAAAKFFGPGSPVGGRFNPLLNGPEYEVVGVVRNSVYSRLRDSDPPTIYVPYTQPVGNSWMGMMTYVVRTDRRPQDVMPALSAAVRALDPMLPASDMKTLGTQLDEHLTQERIMAFLASLFGGITLGLACIGVYGMAAYSVAARTREIGIRVALGAGSGGVLRMVMQRVVLASAAGLAVGAPATYVLQKFLKSQLFGVDPADAGSLVFAGAAVAGAAVLAAWLPARRALRVDPVQALRWE